MSFEKHIAEVMFPLLTQLPRVRFAAIRKIYFGPRFIEQHCSVSGQYQSNKPILYEAGVRKTSLKKIRNTLYDNHTLTKLFKSSLYQKCRFAN